MQKEMWHPNQSPKVVDGYDIKKMVTDHIAFVDSRNELLIQAVDILASLLRRYLERKIEGGGIANALGRLQVARKRGRQLQSVHLLTLAPLPGPRNSLFKALQAVTFASRAMIKSEPESARDKSTVTPIREIMAPDGTIIELPLRGKKANEQAESSA